MRFVCIFFLLIWTFHVKSLEGSEVSQKVCNHLHKDKLLFLCHKDNTLLCDECAMQYHGDHIDQLETLSSVFLKFKMKAKNMKKQDGQDSDQLEKALKDKLGNAYDQFIREITQYKNQWITNNFQKILDKLKSETNPKIDAVVREIEHTYGVMTMSDSIIDSGFKKFKFPQEFGKKFESLKEEAKNELDGLEVNLTFDKILVQSNIKYQTKTIKPAEIQKLIALRKAYSEKEIVDCVYSTVTEKRSLFKEEMKIFKSANLKLESNKPNPSKIPELFDDGDQDIYEWISSYVSDNISDNKKIKLPKVDSTSLYQKYQGTNVNKEEFDYIISLLPRRATDLRLLFSTKRDGWDSSEFHDKCDRKEHTLIIIKSEGKIFGGYAHPAWASKYYYRQTRCIRDDEKESFLFACKPMMFKLPLTERSCALFGSITMGPAFGVSDLKIESGHLTETQNKIYYKSPSKLSNAVDISKSSFDNIDNYEVYQVVFHQLPT